MLGANLLLRDLGELGWTQMGDAAAIDPAQQVFPDVGVELLLGASMTYQVDVTGIDSVVFGALVHTEGDGDPGIFIVDNAGIPGFAFGGFGIERSDPEVLVTSAEIAAGTQTATISISNETETGGKVFVHAVFVYPNMLKNPSFDDLTAVDGENRYTPANWTAMPDSADGIIYRDLLTSFVGYAGNGALQITYLDSDPFTNPHAVAQAPDGMVQGGVYVAGASVVWNDSNTNNVTIAVTNGSLFQIHGEYAQGNRMWGAPSERLPEYQHISAVGKRRLDNNEEGLNARNDNIAIGNMGNRNSTSDFLLDNTYVVHMNDVFPD
jgi:hypothetical protein